MPENNKTEEFLQKLAPCIERGDLDACVEEAAREMGIGAEELLELSGAAGMNGRHDFTYVLALAAAQGFEGEAKAGAYYNAGLAAQNLRKLEKAEDHYKLAIAANPNDAAAHYNYAILLKELNRKPESEEHYKLAIEANPKYAAAHSNYANLLSELNRKQEAEDHYKLAIAANLNYAAAHSNYANLLSELNRKQEAEDHYKLAIAANPNYAAAHYNYAILLKELNRKPEAEDHYKLAIAANPNDAAAHSNYAILLKELDRKPESEDHYKLAIAANPNYAAAHYNYANLLSELNRKQEAEDHYKLAIAANPNNAAAHYNYANLLSELNRKQEAEEHYKLAIAANPNYAAAHSNYAILLSELNRKPESEEHYKLAIAANPNYAAAHYNYAILLKELNRKPEFEEHYKLAIAANPNDAAAHSNYAILLSELDRKPEAEEHYKLAITANPNYAAAHSNYAILLSELDRKPEAEEHYKLAIAANPNLAEAHGAYSFLLIDIDRREEAQEHIETASDLFFKAGRVTDSHLAKAWFYQAYSEKNINRKRFKESSSDANEAGEEYFRSARSAEGDFKENLIMEGNVLKAKSFIRKIPEKSWYKKIYYTFGRNPDIHELIENLKNAAIYYEKASVCPAGERKRKEVCNACSFSMNVFSETLNAMSSFIEGKDAEININKWSDLLGQAHKIYSEKNLKKGIALVETLIQLMKCVNELAEHRKIGLKIQEENLGKCLNNLFEVSNNLEGALKVIAEHSGEAIREYARKQGMGFIPEAKQKISRWDYPSGKALLAYATIIAVIIAILQFTKYDTIVYEHMKSLFFNGSAP